MSEQKSTLATMISVLTPLIIGGLGLYFTHAYKEAEKRASDINEQRLADERDQRLAIDKANVIKGYFEYLANTSDENQQRAALIVLGTLGYNDLVIKVATADPTPGNVQALAAIAATTADSNSANRILDALEAIRRTTTTDGVATAVESALTTSQASQLPTATGAVVVAGADKTPEAAQHEVEQLKKVGFENAHVVKRGEWYRTVVPVEQSSKPAETLQVIKSKVRPNAYVVDERKWCDGSSDSSNCVRVTP